MGKWATMDTIWSSFRPWLSCEDICLLNTPQTGDTASFQRSSSLMEPLDNQGTFVPCAARILWYSADKTSSRQLRDTIGNVCHTPCHNQCDSKSSSGRVMAHENSTLGVEAEFLCKKSLFYGPVEPYFAAHDSVVLTGPICRYGRPRNMENPKPHQRPCRVEIDWPTVPPRFVRQAIEARSVLL